MNTPILYFLPFLHILAPPACILSFSVAIIGLYHRTVRLGNTMKKKISLKHLGVRKRLFIILFLIVLLMAGCFTYIFITLRRQTYARLDTAAYQTAATLLEQASGKVDTLDKVTSYLLQEHYQNNGNGSIFPYLSDYATSEETSAALSKTFTTATRKLFYLFPSLEGLYLYTNGGDPIIFDSRDFTRLNASSLTEAPWREHVINRKGKLVLLKSNQIPSDFNESEEDPSGRASRHYLYGTRVLINLRSSFAPLCLVLAQLDINDLQSSFTRLHSYKGQSYALLDADNGLLSSSDSFPLETMSSRMPATGISSASSEVPYTYVNFKGNINLKGNGYFFHMVTDHSTGLSCVISTPAAVISYMPLVTILVSLLLLLFLIILFVQYTFRGISKPIETLVSACGEIGQGNFSVRVEIPPDAELGYLTNSFNQMAGQVEHLINTVYLKDIAERDLELQMLRNQINPHFLYNTLESMRMAAYTEGAHDISQMCLLLADVLRYGVSSPTELVTLKEEIEHLKEYITLQQYRFHYAVKINVMVSQDLYEFLSLKLMFQPLVENALNHGFEGFTGNERIGIFGYQKEGILYFQVTDNGVGMAPEQVEALNGYIRGENEAFTSIGLKNVHRRIELYYGIGYGLTIESQEGRGTSVCIKIPLTSAK